MGTTLENGVYLPSEGERNCYAGLKTNWEILDQKVADVTALQQAVAGALHREIVESLPTTDIDPNTIYMILSGTSATENVYNEYMYVNNAWELIGTSATDLTNYYTKAEVDGKLLLKASASDLTSHTGDTTIHVTTADKNKWNNQTYVFRYSSTALTASSTNSNALLDNTDNLKVGDKVIDSSVVLFSITAIDTANSTFTIGTALIDLAQDSDVVHKSGNETVGGMKTFSNRTIFSTTSVDSELTLKQNAYDPATNGQSALSSTCSFNVTARSVTNGSFAQIGFYGAPGFTTTRLNCRYYTGASESEESWVEYTVTGTSGSITGRSFKPYNNGLVDLGTNANRWKSVYATNYYYGSNNIEFSTKFVTTDTSQTISGNKTFSSINGVEPSSLSLPDIDNRIDISSYITNLSNVGNEYTPSVNGWICIRSGNATKISVLDVVTSVGNASISNTATYLTIMTPVVANRKVYITVICTSLDHAYFIPCQGNV